MSLSHDSGNFTFVKLRDGYMSEDDGEFFISVTDASDGYPVVSSHRKLVGDPVTDALNLAKSLHACLKRVHNSN